MALISVAGACSRAGKTALAETLLRALPELSRVVAVKFTTTEDVFERCPRGAPCVVCDIDVPFRIVEAQAVLRQPGTDTDRLAATGVARVVWAISRSSAVAAAWAAVRQRTAGFDTLVMEGSTIVQHARPDLCFFVVHGRLAPERWKPGSSELLHAADVVVVNQPAAPAPAPSPCVLAAVQHQRGARPLLRADLTQPLASWAPEWSARLAAIGVAA